MNETLTECRPESIIDLYLHYQTNQYYQRYLKQHKKRADGRRVDQHRTIKINFSKDTVIVNCGFTTIIAKMSTKIDEVVYSPLTQNYGRQLIKITLQTDLVANKYDRNYYRWCEKYVTDLIDWKSIENQLVINNDERQRKAITGEIVIRIADSDGGTEQYCLLAVQMLLWGFCFEVPGGQTNQQLYLDLSDFMFPINYCQVLDEILIDPCAQEQKDSNFQITVLKNILKSQNCIVTQKLHSGNLSQQLVQELQALFLTQMKKLPFDIRKIRQQIKDTTKKCVNIHIHDL